MSNENGLQPFEHEDIEIILYKDVILPKEFAERFDELLFKDELTDEETKELSKLEEIVENYINDCS